MHAFGMTLVLEPIFEADLDPEAYGHRPVTPATNSEGKLGRRDLGM